MNPSLLFGLTERALNLLRVFRADVRDHLAQSTTRFFRRHATPLELHANDAHEMTLAVPYPCDTAPPFGRLQLDRPRRSRCREYERGVDGHAS
ncbi:MAG: hypothetical protein ABSF69_21790 [Polyangiaceae bacterium]